jgi:TRAP-type C4-dicarboxylate transport system permease small subunit
MTITSSSWFSKFHQSIKSLSSWFEWVGLLAMGAMCLTTLIDVIGSKGFQMPLPGSTELTGVLQVVAIAGGLAFSKIDGRHIRVDFLLDWLPKRGEAALDIFSSILGLGFFAIAGWMTFQYGLSIHSSNTETLLLKIRLSPFAFWISLCCIPMCLVIILDLISSIDRMLR